jgi:hypothetical protein
LQKPLVEAGKTPHLEMTEAEIPLQVLWNCLLRQLGPGSAASFLTGTDTALLDYKRGVPVAQPQVEVGEEREAKDNWKVYG